MAEYFTTGLPGLDKVFKGVMPGDNIVWQVDSVSDYRTLVTPYAEAARSAGRRLVYFRFASHAPLLPEDAGIETPLTQHGDDLLCGNMIHCAAPGGCLRGPCRVRGISLNNTANSHSASRREQSSTRRTAP